MSTLPIAHPVSLKDIPECDRDILRSRLDEVFGVRKTTLGKRGEPCTVRQVSALWEDDSATISIRYRRYTVVGGPREEERLLKGMGNLYNRTTLFEFAGSTYHARISSARADMERLPGASGGLPYTVYARVLVSYHVERVQPDVDGFPLIS